MRKISVILTLLALATMSLRATILLQDSSNYPYTNGTIEGQGQWYCYSPSTPALDALVADNVLILNTTNKDSVATPTNGWINPEELNFASFTINVSQLPASTNGGYFCEFQDQNDAHDCCHVFVDTRDTTVPGTYRLGVANYATSFSALTPPVNYPMDLSTGVTYTVVMAFDTNQANLSFVGATLWINPSEQDYQNVVNMDFLGDGVGEGFVYGVDTTSLIPLQDINISQIGFSPYANAGISNVIAASTFDEVNTTNLPVFGIQPQSGNYYSGNNATFYAVASGVDLNYQWYSGTTGKLVDDGVNILGSTSNALIINNLSVSDSYYAVVTDAYNITVTSDTAASTVNTTPTAPFFPSSVTPEYLTNNLFTSTGFTNTALGTGPLYYQWYFAPSNSSTVFSPLDGQISAALNVSLVDYTYQGEYYVVASNSINGGSVAYGPTNTITEIAPLNATLLQLHNLMVSELPTILLNKGGTIYVNTNNVTVSGYVTTYSGFGSSYSEYFIQDTNGYGIEVFLGGNGNTNTPPVGSYVTISGPIEVYHTELEIAPNSLSAITTNVVPVFAVGPKLSNASFNDLSTNGLGTNAVLVSCSMVTFTNVYIYNNRTGGPVTTNVNGGIFNSNANTTLYFTIGKYHFPDNTNWIEAFQYGYNRGLTNANEFAYQKIPTNCYQITGAYLSFGGTPEIVPSRLPDYVTNAPASFLVSVTQAKGAPTVTWPVQTGSTYSVLRTTNLSGPWTRAASGLGYYPTNGSFTDAKPGQTKFYEVTTP